MAWFALSFFITAGSLKLPGANARIVGGVSTMNAAFLPVYLTQDKGFFKDEGLDVLVE
jgi:ABC-type nitrate/sulfonate/bicarbonate transport system substrate-binding protein